MPATDLTSDSERLTPVLDPSSARSARRGWRAHCRCFRCSRHSAVMILWAAHDGGFDEDTWYWGALVMLSLLVISVATSRLRAAAQLPRSLQLALTAFALYVGVVVPFDRMGGVAR